MFKNALRFAVSVTLLSMSVVISFTFCKIDHVKLQADKTILEKNSKLCNLLALKECNCRIKHRPTMHVSENPFVAVKILSSETMLGSGTLKCSVSVREAIDVKDVDAVALLRCRLENYDNQT